MSNICKHGKKKCSIYPFESFSLIASSSLIKSKKSSGCSIEKILKP